MSTEHPDLPSDDEVAFYYRGFRRILQRYRTMTALGWFIAAFGFAGLLFSWETGFPHGIADLVLAGGTIVAGILVVQQAVTSLQEYCSVPFPREAGPHPAIGDVLRLMDEMKRGGWLEARRGKAELERIAERYHIERDRRDRSAFEDQ